MTRTFTSLKTAIVSMVTALAVSIYWKLPGWSILLAAVLGLAHSDYKIVVKREGIEFYSLFRGNRFFQWNEIEKIEHRDNSPLASPYKEPIVLYYSGGLRYKFNLFLISGSHDCLRLINRYAKRHGIPVIDLKHGRRKKALQDSGGKAQ